MAAHTDLLALWAWEYDEPFIHMVCAACASHGVSIEVLGDGDGIDVVSLQRLAQRLEQGELRARAILDRVWDWGGEYESHIDAVVRSVPHRINRYECVRAIWDRTRMHYLFMQHGLRVPYLVQIPSWSDAPDPPRADLSMFGSRFSVKGVYSGGSGVLTPAASWEEVLDRRREWPDDRTLLQEWIEPRTLGERRAWFRVFYACGVATPCWQDDRTHIQTPVSAEDIRRFGLGRLYAITQQIAGLCGLELFSTEIALDVEGRWIIVDYVNDPCDYRPQSTIYNGVPDAVVAKIAGCIASWVGRLRSL